MRLRRQSPIEWRRLGSVDRRQRLTLLAAPSTQNGSEAWRLLVSPATSEKTSPSAKEAEAVPSAVSSATRQRGTGSTSSCSRVPARRSLSNAENTTPPEPTTMTHCTIPVKTSPPNPAQQKKRPLTTTRGQTCHLFRIEWNALR